MNVEIITAFFGQRYAELIKKTLLPSLYAPSNIPAMLADGHSVKHVFYCPSASVFDPGPLPCPFEFKIGFVRNLPKETHETLGAAYKDAIQGGNLTVVAPADHVFGAGLWDTIKLLKKGDYLVCAHPRVNEQSADRVAEFLKQGPPNWQMVNFCMDEIPHQMVKRGIAHNGCQLWRATKQPRCWMTHFADPPPLAFWGEPWMLDAWNIDRDWVGILGVMDHQLPDLALSKGHLRSVKDSQRMFWCELTDERREVLPVPRGLHTEAMRVLDRLPVIWWTEQVNGAFGLSCVGSPT